MQIQHERTIEELAVRDMTEQALGDIAKFFQEQYSQRVTAILAGVDDPKQVGRWIRGEHQPRYDSELRLRTAYQVFRIITRAENAHIARAWMIGLNPQLDDESPINAIAHERYKEVLAAARTYCEGDL
ncbi:XRE family transcriptional regulator (plasmid) [Streptomyces sp. NBC_00080]|uniref:XRE family transcriptional regulator n=1 Tax=unclassified Streptomyces TaxID=2593676 RepID=UPI00114F7E61|nr:XRE family transcriptional regulator [Streptomyces sp. SLBN-115]TQJ37775.1 hypothetical protein FBY34_7929 [Streptomyces sp. SLBN-115]